MRQIVFAATVLLTATAAARYSRAGIFISVTDAETFTETFGLSRCITWRPEIAVRPYQCVTPELSPEPAACASQRESTEPLDT